MLQPSLQAEFDTKCDKCREKIIGGHEVFHIMLDFHKNDDIWFATCCSKKCVEHAIEDHGSELELYSRHAGR